MPLICDQTTALNDLGWQPWLIGHCTACGRELPRAPVPRCDRCGRLAEGIEGVWRISDEQTGRALAVAWVACHGHSCRTDLQPLWQALERKLRRRYGFPLEDL
jgi:hypothetical protein